MKEKCNIEEGNIEDFGTDILNSREEQEAIQTPHIEEGKKHVIANSFARQWATVGDGAYTPIGESVKILPAGLYDFKFRDGQLFFTKKQINIDELLLFTDSVSDQVLIEIEKFWSSSQSFLDYGFLQRRGYLFYGPQGSGKSCLVQLIVKGIIEKGGIAVLGDCPSVLAQALHIFRIIEPNRSIVCLFEDIDAIINNYGEADLLSFLDGEVQVDNVLNIATTNYPERLDKRIIARPRRFDRRIYIGMPDASIRRTYFDRKLKNPTLEEIDIWVGATKDFSFAALADLIISVKCLGNAFEDTIATLKKLQTKSISSNSFEESVVGFSEKNNQ
jgi:hypothetical protein